MYSGIEGSMAAMLDYMYVVCIQTSAALGYRADTMTVCVGTFQKDDIQGV